MERWTVTEENSLRDFISQKLNISKNKSKDIIDSKNVFVNNKRIWIASRKLIPGDIVEIASSVYQNSSDKKLEYQILYEDKFIIAVNKPPYILSNDNKESLESRLRKFRQNNNIQAIHRLDKDTSGVILFAKSRDVFEKYKKIWLDRNIKKVYLAISHNEADFSNIIINREINGKKAVSKVALINKNNNFSCFKIEIKTGRTHQIRIHLASIRHPIAGDKEYGFKEITNPAVKNIPRQMLHSYQLFFNCPFTNNKIKIKAPIPTDFINLGKSLKICIDPETQ
jgi:23S rRNA pseudouridine1911/1915/1917 synthase